MLTDALVWRIIRTEKVNNQSGRQKKSNKSVLLTNPVSTNSPLRNKIPTKTVNYWELFKSLKDPPNKEDIQNRTASVDKSIGKLPIDKKAVQRTVGNAIKRVLSFTKPSNNLEGF